MRLYFVYHLHGLMCVLVCINYPILAEVRDIFCPTPLTLWAALDRNEAACFPSPAVFIYRAGKAICVGRKCCTRAIFYWRSSCTHKCPVWDFCINPFLKKNCIITCACCRLLSFLHLLTKWRGGLWSTKQVYIRILSQCHCILKWVQQVSVVVAL